MQTYFSIIWVFFWSSRNQTRHMEHFQCPGTQLIIYDMGVISIVIQSRPWWWISQSTLPVWKVGCLNPSRVRPKSLKQVVTAPLLKAPQQLWVSHVLRDDHYKQMPCITVGVAHSWILTAPWLWVPSIGQNLQPFNGNGDFSMSEKFSSGMKKTKKQTNIQSYCMLRFSTEYVVYMK